MRTAQQLPVFHDRGMEDFHRHARAAKAVRQYDSVSPCPLQVLRRLILGCPRDNHQLRIQPPCSQCDVEIISIIRQRGDQTLRRLDVALLESFLFFGLGLHDQEVILRVPCDDRGIPDPDSTLFDQHEPARLREAGCLHSAEVNP